MSNSILSMSAEGKQEYCCNIVKINELIPIEGSDFLAKTYINGDSIVVRKDQVHEGEVYFYASNECELSEKFLGANNLFDSDTYEKNSNADEVRPIKENIEKLKKEITNLKKRMKDFMKARRSLEVNNEDRKAVEQAKAKNIITRWLPEGEDIEKYDLMRVLLIIKKDQQKITANEKEIEELRNSYKRKVGFFNKYGRVKCIKLKGIHSFGFIFSKDEMMKAYPEIADFNMEENVGMDFDTVNDELFVKAYVPRVKVRPQKGTSNKAAKKIQKLDRMIPGEFNFHYDTNPLGKNMDKFGPTDVVVIDTKLHGTSAIFSNCKVKFPIKLPIYKKFINFFATKVFKQNEVFPSYYIDYDDVYSSRKVIKNKDLNPNCQQGYYSKDVWGYWAERLKGILSKDMSLYAEIVGYEPGDENRMIQPEYDYGCEPGCSKLLPYRISVVNEDGTRQEYNKEDVYNWTVDLMSEYSELASDIIPVDILYHGKMKDLYPHISTDDLSEWRNQVLIEMSNDTELFGMELDEPMCKNNVPREGLIIRKDNDDILEAFKLKTQSFRDWERKKIDDGIIDSEMNEAYYEEENN